MTKDTEVIASILGHINSQLCLNKAFSQVILEELAKVHHLDYSSLITDVEKLHAQYILDSNQTIVNLINGVLNPDVPDSWLKDQLGL